jgi:hypothetical protein
MAWMRRALWAGFGVFALVEAAIVGALFESSWFAPLHALVGTIPRLATLGLAIIVAAAVTSGFALLVARMKEMTATKDEIAGLGQHLRSAESYLLRVRQFREAKGTRS